MKLTSLITLTIASGILFTGCVSKKKYTELQGRYKESQSALVKASSKNMECQSALKVKNMRVENLEEQLASEKSNLISLQSALDKCLTASNQGGVNIAKLVDEINASNKYIQHLVNLKNKSDSLNQVLTNNLTRSLSSEELRDVDVKVLKGVVYVSLSDNMLYKSGSYQVSDKAGETLSKIAKIIKDHQDYDVLVEGNTDDVPISKTNIRNNWDLSTLRASSVVQVLQNRYNIAPERLTAAGRGEYNPIADNTTASGKAKNRRTQIIITPKLDEFMDLIEKGDEVEDSNKMRDGHIIEEGDN